MIKLPTLLLMLVVSTSFAQTLQIGIQAAYNRTQLYNKDDYSDKKSLIIKNSFAPSYGLLVGVKIKKIDIQACPSKATILQNYTLAQDTAQRLHANAYIKQQIYQLPISVTYKFNEDKLFAPYVQLGVVLTKLNHTISEIKGTIYDSVYFYSQTKDVTSSTQSSVYKPSYDTASHLAFNTMWLGYQIAAGVNYKISENIQGSIAIHYASTIGNVEYRKPMDIATTFGISHFTRHVEDFYQNVKPAFFQKSSTDNSIRTSTSARQLGIHISLVYNINLRKNNN